ncbi:ATP-binding cassette domain-containing protein [Bradyrhizobium sp. 190]|uniref:ABC transporter ATP-binding protein n=1 Tax=Bradyrhizobium sp. 190 TaxID=2782658 RepID=UPI001FF7B692|nr:ATP-binding cassette domain-containing protein [Bradyrhizobium sp. 190]MCK1513194.1 ATP-binding cassette domain-containing protein [Bradyrhizobium sp. 190]
MSLNVANLSAYYGQSRVLWDLSLTAPRGGVVGVLGRNGAGKTTLLRSIAGLHRHVTGSVIANDVQICGWRADQVARQGVTLSREGGRLPGSLTVYDNLMLGRRLALGRGKPPRDLADVWKWFPLLEPLAGRAAALLSGGQRQALVLAVAFISNPTVLLLDEPSAGLAPPVARDLFSTIRELANHGLTVLVVEQAPAWLVGVADDCYLLEVGKVVDHGSLERLMHGIEHDINKARPVVS